MTIRGAELLAVLAAATSAIAIGGIRDSRFVFGGIWERADQFRDGKPAGSPEKAFSVSLILSGITGPNLAFFPNDSKAQ